MQRRPFVRALAVVGAALLAAATVPAATAPTPAVAAPTLSVTTVVSGLAIPWDVTFMAADLMLFNEKFGRIWSKRGSAAPRAMSVSGLPTISGRGEGGLLGMVADPAAATNKRFYVCLAYESGGPVDVRVLRFRLTGDTTAVSDGAPVVTGMPLTTGRHSGCRLRFGPDGYLYVATGDAAQGSNPQNLQSLGGKVLRVRWDGYAPPDNPFYSRGGNARYVWTFGHRNLQGLVVRPGTSELWSVEHGPDRDDEVNLIERGGNYGWDPVPGYNESVPMTDLSKFPSAKVARWSSGPSTVATSGAAFLSGGGWGEYQGWLAVGVLKDEGIKLLRLAPSPTTGRVVETRNLAVAEGFGRIRTVQSGPDGSIYFTTSNGSGDRIVRIAPTARTPVVPAGQLVSTVGVTAARTGSAITAFVRSTGDNVYFRRSTNDGVTWSGYVYGGVATNNPPSAASSAPGRVDLFTRNAALQVVHTWYVNGVRAGSTNLGGGVIAQHGSSVGNGALDVWGVSASGTGWRNHFDGRRWSGWAPIGGIFTSGMSASANLSNGYTIVSGRGRDGYSWERTFTATAGLGTWIRRSGGMSSFSTRALGDWYTGSRIVTVTSGSDRNATVERGGGLVLGVPALYNSAPDVVTRPDGTFMMFGRSTNLGLWYYDARPGGYVNQQLGGVVY